MSYPSDNEPQVEIITDEPSRVHRVMMPPPPAPGEKLWRWALLVFSTLGAAVLLAGGLGRALYVTRAEYTTEVQNQAVARENMATTLNRLDKTLDAQASAFDRLAGQVQTIKIDLAVAAANAAAKKR